MKCYYCNNKATYIKTYVDEVDGISYEYEHCNDHKDINDHSQEAIDLWVQHGREADGIQ